MKQYNFSLPFLLLLFFFAGCGQNENKETTQKNTSESNKPTTDEKSTSSSTAGCFLAYREKTCELISVEQMADILGIATDQISTRDNSEILKSSPNLIACLFETQGDTKQGTITVGQINNEEPDVFKNKYNNEYYSSDGREATYLDDKLGDGAVYLNVSNNSILTVLSGTETFSVQIYGNQKTKEENLEVAKKVALEVLKKCK